MDKLEAEHLEKIKLAFENNPELTCIIFDEEISSLNQNIDNCLKVNETIEKNNKDIEDEITKLKKKILQNKYNISENNKYIELYKAKIDRLQLNQLSDNDFNSLWYNFLRIN